MRRIFFSCLLVLLPVLGFAQNLINCAPATPCTTSGPANTGTGDRAWLSFGKANANFLDLYSGAGTGVSKIVATYAAARTFPGTTTGDVIQVLGRTAKSDGGQGFFTWVAGGTTTIDDGYVLQATGGTWQRQDPSPTAGETQLNAAWYNIKPSNTGTVNDAGFAKLKAQMQTSGTTTWRVFFPPGAYTYTYPYLLFGVQRVIIDAYDCTFQNTSAVVGSAVPLTNPDFFMDWGDIIFPGTGVYSGGYLFNTAVAGTLSLTTTTHADAGNFTPGMRVFLGGYDQQFSGYPPNFRYFEYKTVATTNSGTGVVTFTNPLKYLYDSRWWDTPNLITTGKPGGAPRIWSLERTNFKQPKLIWLKGATFLPPLNFPTNYPVVGLVGDLVILEDVTGNVVAIGQSDTFVLRRSNFTSNSATFGAAVPDKLVGRLIIEDSILDGTVGGATANSISDAVGVDSLSIIRSKLYGGVQSVAPRSLSIDDSDLIPQNGAYTAVATQQLNPLRAVTIKNTRAFNPGGGNFASAFQNKASPGFSLTVGSVVGTDIRITFDATGQTVAQQIDYGMTLTNTVTGNAGIITAIYYETGSPGTLRIAGTWSAPTAADVFHYYDVMQKSDGGGNVVIGAQVPFWGAQSIPQLSSTIILDKLTFPAINIVPSSITNTYNGLMFGAGSGNAFLLDGNSIAMQGSTYIAFPAGTPGVYYTEGGSAALVGEATLAGGTVTVATTRAQTNSRIILSRHTAGGTTGTLTYTVVNSVSFTINSSSGTDTSTVSWFIINHQ